jgi:hypothetical protein
LDMEFEMMEQECELLSGIGTAYARQEGETKAPTLSNLIEEPPSQQHLPVNAALIAI